MRPYRFKARPMRPTFRGSVVGGEDAGEVREEGWRSADGRVLGPLVDLLPVGPVDGVGIDSDG